MSDPIWKEEERYSCKEKDADHGPPPRKKRCMAEATGVFFYVFAGISATTVFTINQENAAFGSIFQIGTFYILIPIKKNPPFSSSPPSKPGAAFALGIAFAIITCASTSGGHFNPAITICFAIWQGFPWRKVPHYIFSQILGAFIAGLLMMGMYHQQLSEFETSLRAAGHTGSMVFNGGPASVLCSIPNTNQTNLGYLVLIEFFVDFYIVSFSSLPPFFFLSSTNSSSTTGHNNLGSPRPGQPLRLRLLRALRNRPRLRNNDMGLGTGHNLHKPGTRFRHKNRRSNFLWGRSFFFS